MLYANYKAVFKENVILFVSLSILKGIKLNLSFFKCLNDISWWFGQNFFFYSLHRFLR